MNELLTSVAIGISAFVATNIDDILILTLFFAQVNDTFRPYQVVIGQYLGFSALIVASLPGFFGGVFVPKAWIGFLGLLPILIGITHLGKWYKSEDEVQAVPRPEDAADNKSVRRLLNRQTYSLAAVTVANGGDNIGIYVPLFASSNWGELVVLVGVFLTLVGVWCFIGYRLTLYPAIARLLSRYSTRLVPFVLISLGVFILLENGTINWLRGAAE